MSTRILYVILLCFLVLYVPYWLYIPAIIFGIIIFPLFWEAVLIAIFVDYFYGPRVYTGSLFAYPFGITAAMLVIASADLKERLRIHA